MRERWILPCHILVEDVHIPKGSNSHWSIFTHIVHIHTCHDQPPPRVALTKTEKELKLYKDMCPWKSNPVHLEVFRNGGWGVWRFPGGWLDEKRPLDSLCLSVLTVSVLVDSWLRAAVLSPSCYTSNHLGNWQIKTSLRVHIRLIKSDNLGIESRIRSFKVPQEPKNH